MAKRTGRQIRDKDGDLVAVVGKAANGEGSVYWVATRSRWIATYRDANDKLRTVTGKTKGEAVERRDRKVSEIAEVGTPDRRVLGAAPTIAELCDWWVTHRMDVRPSTAVAYRRHVSMICDRIGGVLVEDLDVGRVEELLTALKNFAPDTIRNVRARLRQIAETGVDLGYLDRNPVVKAKAPRSTARKGARGPKRILTPDETARLVEACAAHKLGAAVACLFLMGNRSSEVLGLAWSDLDLDAGTATIKRGSVYVQGIGQHLDDPKTEGTAGVHHLPPSVVALLRRRRKVQVVERLEAGPAWQTITYEGEMLDMVFTNETGGLVLSQKLYAAVQDCCAIAGVDARSVGTHTGRRTVITQLRQAGVDVDDIAELVGHGSPATTRGYIQGTGTRPQVTARIAAELLDPMTRAGDA